MFQFFFLISNIITSTIFMYMKHPMAVGMTLLLQTILICVTTGLISKSFWFSYILFLVFLGGMLVLFIYVTSLASNEMFSFSFKMFIFYLLFLFMIFSTMLTLDFNISYPFLNNNEMMLFSNQSSYLMENSISLNKLYNFPTNLITIILINYLFLTLVAIVKITDSNQGPLRPSI